VRRLLLPSTSRAEEAGFRAGTLDHGEEESGAAAVIVTGYDVFAWLERVSRFPARCIRTFGADTD
jgi:hypothetical protein